MISEHRKNYYTQLQEQGFTANEFEDIPPHLLHYQHSGDQFSSDCLLQPYRAVCRQYLPSGNIKLVESSAEELQQHFARMHEALIPFIEPGKYREETMFVPRKDGELDIGEIIKNYEPDSIETPESAFLKKFSNSIERCQWDIIKDAISDTLCANNKALLQRVIKDIKKSSLPKWEEYQKEQEGRKKEKSQGITQQEPQRNAHHFIEKFLDYMLQQCSYLIDENFQTKLRSHKLSKIYAYEALDSDDKRELERIIRPYALVTTPDDIQEKLDTLYSELHMEMNKEDYDPVYAAALMCVAYAEIHPRNNGNGRISRTAANMILMQAGIMPVSFDSEEAFMDALIEAQTKGDPEIFAQYLYDNICRISALHQSPEYMEKFQPFSETAIREIDQQFMDLTKAHNINESAKVEHISVPLSGIKFQIEARRLKGNPVVECFLLSKNSENKTWCSIINATGGAGYFDEIYESFSKFVQERGITLRGLFEEDASTYSHRNAVTAQQSKTMTR